ncbi:hypothetical protein L6164_001537 [Bauhinia variegata]|uniref:Uncharacterized protein n=1 Tax=Bauhinia variegata TaxID=167791 RepID=A0ACB9Q946_BAUVA|nr:hypothetical protein L6164_001537 [Bauhinia variegata]
MENFGSLRNSESEQDEQEDIEGKSSDQPSGDDERLEPAIELAAGEVLINLGSLELSSHSLQMRNDSAMKARKQKEV